MIQKNILFISVHNGARSQMAEALLNDMCHDYFVAHSAGLEPGVLDPIAIEVMQEIGIDISRNQTKTITDIVAKLGPGSASDTFAGPIKSITSHKSAARSRPSSAAAIAGCAQAARQALGVRRTCRGVIASAPRSVIALRKTGSSRKRNVPSRAPAPSARCRSAHLA